jgi:RNA polymerase sigma factor (sigma-70 family)
LNSKLIVTDPLIELCKEGDTKAFHQLYLQYSKRVYSTIVRIAGNRTDAEDLLQETFVDAFKYIKTYNYQSHFSYWIKRIAINNSITHLRKKREWVEFDNEHHDQGDEVVNTEQLQTYKVEIIKEAIKQIPLIYSTVFTLYVFEGYDQEEIAEILDISHNTVRTRYARAKEKIRTLINQMNCYA